MDEERYSRQIRLPQVGPEGQKKICGSRILVVGCGATGSSAAQLLVAAGIGSLVLIDRDSVEVSNLPRQPLFSEEDADRRRFKVDAARDRLAVINSSVEIIAHVGQFPDGPTEALLESADLAIDGSDNWETRLRINRLCIEMKKPWVYCAAIGASGSAMLLVPGITGCLRCLAPGVRAATPAARCDATGVWGPAAAMAGSLAASEAMRHLIDPRQAAGLLLYFDLWAPAFSEIEIPARTGCPDCAAPSRSFGSEIEAPAFMTLCGKDSVQINLPGPCDLDRLAQKAPPDRILEQRKYLIRLAAAEGCSVTIFPSGVAIVDGTKQGEQALRVLKEFLED